MLDLSAIEPVVVMKRTKLRRVQLLSDSSDDEDGSDQNHNTTLHLSDNDNEVAQNIGQKQCLSIKNSSQNNSEQTTSNNKQPSDGPVRKYKFRKIHSTTSTITKPIQQHQNNTKPVKKSNPITPTTSKIEIYEDGSPNTPNSSLVGVSNVRDCLMETILTTPCSKPSIESILEKDLSFSIDGSIDLDPSLFNDEISPCVLSQQSTHGRINEPRSRDTTPKAPTKKTKLNTLKQTTPTKTDRNTNVTIDTSPVCLSPFGMSDRRYNFKNFRRTFKHYNPVGKRALKNLENISMDSDIIWPTP